MVVGRCGRRVRRGELGWRESESERERDGGRGLKVGKKDGEARGGARGVEARGRGDGRGGNIGAERSEMRALRPRRFLRLAPSLLRAASASASASSSWPSSLPAKAAPDRTRSTQSQTPPLGPVCLPLSFGVVPRRRGHVSRDRPMLRDPWTTRHR